MKPETDILEDKSQMYKLLRTHYHAARDLLRIEIKEHEQKIRGLEKQIKEIRPRTEHRDMICESCDMISMKYIGMVPGQGGSIRCYECEVCGREYSHT